MACGGCDPAGNWSNSCTDPNIDPSYCPPGAVPTDPTQPGPLQTPSVGDTVGNFANGIANVLSPQNVTLLLIVGAGLLALTLVRDVGLGGRL